MSFRVIRITRCAELIKHWPFFLQGIEFTAKYLHYPYTFDTYRRILQRLVTTPTAFVAIVLNDDLPVCFGAAFDCTPIHGTEREYDIPFIYHQPNHLPATSALRNEFERFCRRMKVKRYFMTTTAFNGMAQKCIPRFGFKRSHVVYKREL